MWKLAQHLLSYRSKEVSHKKYKMDLGFKHIIGKREHCRWKEEHKLRKKMLAKVLYMCNISTKQIYYLSLCLQQKKHSPPLTVIISEMTTKEAKAKKVT